MLDSTKPNFGYYKRTTMIFAMIIVIAFILKAVFMFIYPIYEDEFNYLAKVYEYERGELSIPFQCFHVHFLGWLSAFGNNEFNQIVAARILMYLLLLGTCLYLFLLAHHFLSIHSSLLTVLCYVCTFFVIANGASFRSDTPATFFFMLAIYYFIVKEDSLFSYLLAGISMAVSIIFTIKASVYLPLFAIWFLLRQHLIIGWRKSLQRAAGFWGALVFSFILLFKLHSSTLVQQTDNLSKGFLNRAFSTFIDFDQLLSAWQWIIRMLILDSVVFFLLICGLIAYMVECIRRRYSRDNPRKYLPALLTPLLSLLFFKYCRPYLFVFLMPTAMVFCGYGYEFLAAKRIRIKKPSNILLMALGIILLSNYITSIPRYIRYNDNLTSDQKDILDSIHKIFPEPVPYVDRFSMVSTYPKVGFFMTEAGTRNYLQNGEPKIKELLTKKKPIFMLENSSQLNLRSWDNYQPLVNAKIGLLEEDWKALQSYFIHHSGPIWVVGKKFDLKQPKETQQFKILLPGLYTVETKADIIIDSITYHDGAVINLEVGLHTISTNDLVTNVKLRGGDHLSRPDISVKGGYLGAPFF